VRRDNRSAVWGGATLGLVIGALIGVFGGQFWASVLWGLGIGAVVGFAAAFLGWISDLLRYRMEHRYGTKEEIAAYRRQLAELGIQGEDAAKNVEQYRTSGDRYIVTEDDLERYQRELTEAGVPSPYVFWPVKQYGLTREKPQYVVSLSELGRYRAELTEAGVNGWDTFVLSHEYGLTGEKPPLPTS
jgi:hypothetical protein